MLACLWNDFYVLVCNHFLMGPLSFKGKFNFYIVEVGMLSVELWFLILFPVVAASALVLSRLADRR